RLVPAQNLAAEVLAQARYRVDDLFCQSRIAVLKIGDESGSDILDLLHGQMRLFELPDRRDQYTRILPDDLARYAAQRTENAGIGSDHDRMLCGKVACPGYLIEQLCHLCGVSLLLDRRQDSSNGSLRGCRIDVRLAGNGVDEALKGGCHFSNSLLST